MTKQPTQTRRGGNLIAALPQMEREHLELHAGEIAFSAAVVAGAPRAEIFIRATQLLEDFQRHFESEEGLMRFSKFPGLEPHMEEHRKLIEQMSGLRDDIGSDVISGAMPLHSSCGFGQSSMCQVPMRLSRVSWPGRRLGRVELRLLAQSFHELVEEGLSLIE